MEFPRYMVLFVCSVPFCFLGAATGWGVLRRRYSVFFFFSRSFGIFFMVFFLFFHGG